MNVIKMLSVFFLCEVFLLMAAYGEGKGKKMSAEEEQDMFAEFLEPKDKKEQPTKRVETITAFRKGIKYEQNPKTGVWTKTGEYDAVYKQGPIVEEIPESLRKQFEAAEKLLPRGNTEVVPEGLKKQFQAAEKLLPRTPEKK